MAGGGGGWTNSLIMRAATTGGERRVDLRVDSGGLVIGDALGLWPAVGVVFEHKLTDLEVVGNHLLS